MMSPLLQIYCSLFVSFRVLMTCFPFFPFSRKEISTFPLSRYGSASSLPCYDFYDLLMRKDNGKCREEKVFSR